MPLSALLNTLCQRRTFSSITRDHMESGYHFCFIRLHTSVSQLIIEGIANLFFK
jgi:hypothetical protein